MTESELSLTEYRIWRLRSLWIFGDLELLSVIQSDSKLAQADVLGENVFNLPDDAIIVEGAKKALVNMGIL